ncbi:MAG: FKBP-type peptidyl-prolyl cis-trans isomerase [Roseburia sp.]|nr:FKBP-type peptidyl-prolyl cis-trans isomerase [Roseburia sp.]
MAKNKNTGANEDTGISKSKAKREERKKAVAQKRRSQQIARAGGIAVVTAIVLLIAFFVGKQLCLLAVRTAVSSDYSAGLTADGRLEGVDVQSALTLVNYENIPIPADELAATTEEVDADIASMLSAHTALRTEEDLKIADGDRVNIDYVGSIDGVEFEGGNSNGAGYTLTIGSGTFIDDFEQQLIGHAPLEELTVLATFPETYDNNPDLAGKEASFAVTINGIYVTPELTDEFVAENLAETEGVSTAAEYRAKVENRFYEENLQEYLTDYIVANSTVTAYPKSYLKILKSLTKYDDEAMAAYYNQMLAAYGVSYDTAWEARGSEDEFAYEKELTQRAQDTLKAILVYQAIYEKAGLAIDMEAAITEMTEEYGEDYVTQTRELYGEAYMAQAELKEVVTDYLMSLYR